MGEREREREKREGGEGELDQELEGEEGEKMMENSKSYIVRKRVKVRQFDKQATEQEYL